MHPKGQGGSGFSGIGDLVHFSHNDQEHSENLGRGIARNLDDFTISDAGERNDGHVNVVDDSVLLAKEGIIASTSDEKYQKYEDQKKV